MSSSRPLLNRFLVTTQFSVYYRQVKKLDWKPPARSDYVAIAVLSGNLKCRIDDRIREISGGQWLLLAPPMVASLSGQSIEMVTLTATPAFLIDHGIRMHLIGPEDTLTFHQDFIEDDHSLVRLAQNLAAELTEQKPGREIVVAALAEQVVVQLLREHSSMRRSAQLELSRVGLVDRRIRRSVELMHAQLEHDLTVREIAAASYMSPFHFVRVFKKLTGTTPHAYLANIRTARAQTLLADPNLSITEISSRVGYSSPSHFSKAFRQATGLTPRAFRQALISS